jgi:Bacterial protein of unknown function (DUF839)
MWRPVRVALAALGSGIIVAAAGCADDEALAPIDAGKPSDTGGGTPEPGAGGAGGQGGAPEPGAGGAGGQGGGSGGAPPAPPTAIGPSTLQSPYVVPVAEGVRVVSIASNGFADPLQLASHDAMRAWDERYPHLDGNSAGYRLVGAPDGLGAIRNGDGTFTLLMNHELYNFAGDPAARRLGSNGAFVSEWTIRADPDHLEVLGGRDFISSVYLYEPQAGDAYGYTEHTSFAPFVGIERLCSADLPPASAFFDSASGKGTTTRLLLTGEESDGRESYADYVSGKQDKGGYVNPPLASINRLDRSTEVGREFAVPTEGADRGKAWELPYLGKFRWENALASAKEQEKTVVVGLDDFGDGYVFVYIGQKQSTGSDIEKAGLANGALHALDVEGDFGTDQQIDPEEIPTGPARFSLVEFTPDADGPVSRWSQPKLRQAAAQRGVIAFRSPEDGAWDPADPDTLYFVTSASNAPHVWKVVFDNIEDPSAGGTVEVMIDGNAYNALVGNNEYGEPAFARPDNMTAVTGRDGRTRLLIQEDRGGASTPSRIWLYDVGTEELTLIATMDPLRFAAGAPYLLANIDEMVSGADGDEESSAITPAYDVLGEGWFLLTAQAHYHVEDLGGDPTRLRELFEGGQLMAMYVPQALGD